jgi:hypothetical protein
MTNQPDARVPSEGPVPNSGCPTLPSDLLAELESIEFRVNGADARASRIESLLARAEGLRAEIRAWVQFVRGETVR